MRFSTLLVASATLALAASTVLAGEASGIEAAHARGRAVPITSATIEAPDRFVVTFEVGSNEVVVTAQGSFRLNGVRYTMLDINGEAHVVRTAWHDELNRQTYAFDGSATEVAFADTEEAEAWLRGLGEALEAASASTQGASAIGAPTGGGSGGWGALIGAIVDWLTPGPSPPPSRGPVLVIINSEDIDITITSGPSTPAPAPDPAPAPAPDPAPEPSPDGGSGGGGSSSG